MIEGLRIKYLMRFYEFGIKPIKPLSALTPEKARLAHLKQSSEQAKKRYKAERERQNLIKSQRKIFNLSRP
jgi:hypothetical protein